MLQCKVMKSMYIYMLHCGDDNNNGTIDNPVKTIKRATEILESKTTEAKEKIIVIISNLDLNTQEYLSGSSITPVVTSNDGYNDFQRYIELKDSTNNIGQNLIFKNIQLKSIYGEKNIFANGHSLTIDEGVETNVNDEGKYKINIYGGNHTANIGTGNNINIEINSGRWTNIYGGNYQGTITGIKTQDEATTSKINVTINNGTINSVYGGNNKGTITGRKINVTINDGTINSVFGGNYSGTINDSAVEINVIGGEILGYKTYNEETGKAQQNEGHVCGGSRTGIINETSTTVNINGGNMYYVLGGSVGAIMNSCNTNVTVFNGKVESVVYGGSMNTSAHITESTNVENVTNVNIKGGEANGVYGGSHNGKITGNTNVIIEGGTIVYAYGGSGSDNGEITGNTNLEITGGTITSLAYGGSNKGYITGDTKFKVTAGGFSGICAGSNIGGIGGSTSLELSGKNISIGSNNIYIGSREGTVGGNSTFIASDTSCRLYIEKIGNTTGNTDIEFVNNSGAVKFIQEATIDSLTLRGTKLQVEKNLHTKKFIGAGKGEESGTLIVFNEFNIDSAEGTTILETGRISETKNINESDENDKDVVESDFETNDFLVKDPSNGDIEPIFNPTLEENAKTRTKIWEYGSNIKADVVYLDGTNGNDSKENAGSTPDNPLKTLKQAYYCLNNRGTIVLCGPTEVDVWPDSATKTATITSAYKNEDYRKSAKLVLNPTNAASALTLQGETKFENLTFEVGKTNNLYANGKTLTLGDGIEINKIDDGNLSIYGGSSTGEVESTTIDIHSGTYRNVVGGGTNVKGSINVNIYGGTIETIKTKDNSEYVSNGFNLTTSNAKIEKIYYESDKETTITIGDDSEVTNLIAEDYTTEASTEGSTEVKNVSINISTSNPINIDGKNKGKETDKITFKETTIDASILNNVIPIEVINSVLTINNNVETLDLSKINFDNTSTIKIPNTSKQINVKGDFNGSGNLYLNDGIKLDIKGKVLGSTKVYCNDGTVNLPGTIITATQQDDAEDADAFITPDDNNTPWSNKEYESKRLWQQQEFNINSIIYVSNSGSSDALGTINMPVNTLQAAYEVAKNRRNEGKGSKYYIVLKDNITIDNTTSTGNLGNIKVVISSREPSKDVVQDSNETSYNSSLIINAEKFNFAGTTTVENITIDTTKYNNSVEFFANGKTVIFGEGITINSQAQKYPIIYGGAAEASVKNDINLTVNSGTYNMIFGGGKNGTVECDNITLNIGNINLKGYGKDNDGQTGLFGAGRYGNVTGNITLNIDSGEFYRIYGAGLEGTLDGDITLNHNAGATNRLYGGGQLGEVNGEVTIKIGGTDSTAIVSSYLRGSGQYSGITGTTELNIWSGAELGVGAQVAAGGYQGNVAGTSTINIYGGTINSDIYGGGWGLIGDPTKGLAGNTMVHIYENAVINGDIYGGGYAGAADNTTVIIQNATANNVYGGGNEAEINGDTNVKLTNATIKESAYAGGKGTTATVKGNSIITADGTTNITENLFGGGNASMTGQIDNNSTTNVYIVGGTIGRDIYGGANTSVVYGNTNVKIGKEAVNIQDLSIAPINIGGSIYGGGKTNETGSEDYDFTTNSVIGDVNIDINAKDVQLNIGTGGTYTSEDGEDKIGNIFASGNATKISGNGYINISNYGTDDVPKQLKSIQRAKEVNVDNSSLWILGRTDRTNEMSSIKYTINRVEDFKLKNNSTLYLENGVNVLENLYSLDLDGNIVQVNEDGSINQNVSNKIYLLQGKNMKLAKEGGNNGSVYGIMFLGRFDSIHNEETNEYTIERGIYSCKQGTTVTEDIKNKITIASYVQAEYGKVKDVFYTNYVDEENSIINVQFIDPATDNATYYQWGIGDREVIVYENIELIASKYSSTGLVTLELVGLNDPNMILKVNSIDTSELNDNNIILEDESDIPDMAENADKANSVFGLSMETGYQGWKANGKTIYKNGEDNNIQGTNCYYADNSDTIPTLTFNLVHSKNVTEKNKDIGTVKINLTAICGDTTKDVIIELTLKVVNIESSIDYYEGAITPGLKYDVFPSSTTNITSRSTITAYYSVLLNNYDTTNYYENYEGYYHALSSSFVLPQGTKIILIDKSKGTDYYYYIVSADDEQNGRTLYEFTDFTVMGTLGETYSDANNSSYYIKDENSVFEKFIVQLNFEDAIIKEEYTGQNQSLKIQLMDKTDNSVRLTVNEDYYPMIYNIYNNLQAEKSVEVTNKETIQLYEPQDIQFTINTKYIQPIVDSSIVYDTTNFDNAEGLRATFSLNGEQLSQEELGGISITYNGKSYFADDEGAISFKIADAVCNLETNMQLNLTPKQDWKLGTYTINIEAVGSADGTNVLNRIGSDNVTIVFSKSDYGLDVQLDSNSQIIDKNTGKTLNEDNELNFGINYTSVLDNPNIRVALYRRQYAEGENQNIYSTEYNLVNLKDFVTNDLAVSNNENEYIVTASPVDSQSFTLNLKQDSTLTTGTYKVKFLIYDGDNYIGEVYKMIIIR